MNALSVITVQTPQSQVLPSSAPLDSHRAIPPRAIGPLHTALQQLVNGSPDLLSEQSLSIQSDTATHSLLRYVFVGPKGGDEPIRIGVFAGIHGDEPEGVYALVRFLRLVEKQPELATGYCLFFYPICNPGGFEARTRHALSGKDLNREFWRDSKEPEVVLLERELRTQRFDGIISLHTDDSVTGFYGFAHGATITRHLLEPALAAADEFVPTHTESLIDGFNATAGIIYDAYEGILCAPPDIRPRPFEITLETPQAAPEYLKEAAFVAALKAILVRYREFIAYAQNL